MKEILDGIGRAVRGYRLGMEGEGSRAMVEVIDGIMKNVESGALKSQDLVSQLQRVMQAQARGDYLYVADVLEYEIASVISSG